MRYWVAAAFLGVPLAVGFGQPGSRVAKRAIRADGDGMVEQLVNGGFEEAAEAARTATGWDYWDNGYRLERDTVRTGAAAARCVSTDAEVEYGAGQAIQLDQQDALPIIAGGWSKAEDVSGSPDSGYSVYVDLLYTDGTPLWGQIAAFDTGSHDWQYRQVTVVPERPIRELRVYGLFRGHTGTVYFDDFSAKQVALPEGARLFDGVPVAAGAAPGTGRASPRHTLDVGSGLVLEVEDATGALLVAGLHDGGFLLRDVAANSDFLQPVCEVTPHGDGAAVRLAGTCEELSLAIEADLAVRDGVLRIDGKVRDLRGEDRAVAVYFVLPADFRGGRFGRDIRHDQEIDQAATHENTVTVGAGTNGKLSRYPIAAVMRDERGLCIATPLDAPRVSRLAYDAGSRELYAAFDLGLSRATTKFPSTATFSLALYGFEAEWGFRAALARYYELFPEFFVKRVEREGIWMPFTDIATVQDAEDFGFMFKEGDNNVAWDEAHGIYTFVYVEPMSHWLPLGAEAERTYEAAFAELVRRAETEPQAQATLNSATATQDGAYELSIQNAPWCDGALIINNPDPDLLADQPEATTQAKHEFATVARAFESASRATAVDWRGYGGDFEVVGDAPHSGERAARCANQPGQEHGLSQTVVVGQNEPEPLVARAWSRAEGVTGDADTDYSLYLDLVYSDGTPSFGHVTPFRSGTHGWEQAEVVIRPEKPIRTATLNLLLRRQHAGTAWFDDIFLGGEGSNENRVKQPGFETPAEPPQPAELDGTYIDSYEMAATTRNFRREQWAYLDLPLTFDLNTREVCSLVVFHTYEFERELARRMHEKGKLLFANAVLSRFAFPAHLLDVMGIETNWASAGNYSPNPDEIMNFRRALCFQKPYLLLLNTDYAAFKPEWVELYFKRSAFYGIFPSFFSHNAADDPYWQNPALYNRDRAIFRKYIPLICTLNAAGWQPVTHARVESEAGSVYVERFGEEPSAGVYLTLLNDSHEPREYQMTVDAGSLGLAMGRTTGEDVLSGEDVALSREQGHLTLRGELAAEDLRVVRLGTQ